MEYLAALTNQREGRIEVHDLGKGALSESSLVWTQKCRDSAIAGIKLRRYKGRLAVIAAHGYTGAVMFDYETHDVIWSTSCTGANPHSVELIPFENGNYLIAVASSVGNDVSFFDPADDGASKAGAIYAPDGHGVLYDPDNNCLWILSKNLLTKNEIAWDGAELAERCLATYTAPSDEGHDLAPVYGDKNRLWVALDRKVYQFDKTQERFLDDYEAEPHLNTPERMAIGDGDRQIKGIGNFRDGSCIKIYPDSRYFSWTSKTLCFIKKNADGSFEKLSMKSDMGDYYKARVFCEDYC